MSSTNNASPTSAEIEFNARFPEDGEAEPTQEDLRAFAQAWLEEVLNHEGDDTYKIEADFFDGYADGSETDKGVISANWNYVAQTTQDRLEAAGYTLDWCDQVSRCDDCGKCVETEPTHYGWKRQFHVGDGYLLCACCLERDPEPLLEALRGDETKALTLDNIDLADHGYVRVERDFENGWYGGQDDSPKAIAAWLRERDIEDFIFEIDNVGQFDVHFGVWVREEDAEKAEGARGKAAVDPARAMEAALRSIPPATGEGIHYTRVSVGDEGATITTRTISPEEFVAGIKD